MPSDSRRNKERDDADRRTRSASSGKRSSWRDGIGQESPAPDSPIQQERPQSDPEPASQVGHKWRDMQRQTETEGELPPLPGQSPRGGGRGGGVGNRAIIFGAVLLAIVVGMLFLPFSPLVDNEADPTPTALVADVTQIATEPPTGYETPVPTNEPAETVDSDFLVCIDPGHGGWDFGRERMSMDEFGPPWFHESEVTLSMSFFLRDELESRGIAVVMTRETGGAVNWRNEDINGDGRVLTNSAQGRIDGARDELQARINICNEAGADILISLHLNGHDDQSIGGYEVFYNSQRDFTDQNRDLASFLHREMTVAFADLEYVTGNRGIKDDIDLSAQTHEFGSEQFLIMIGPELVRPEYTIVPSAMPGVIVEALFVTNTNDANFIMNPANQKRLAVGWADGIDQYRDRWGD